MFVVLYKPKWALLNAKVCRGRRFKRGSCGGQVVCVLAFYSDDLVRIPLTPSVFSVKFLFERMKINKKRPGYVHFK